MHPRVLVLQQLENTGCQVRCNDCVAAMLGNILCAAIYMALSRLVPKIFLVKSQNLTPESTRGYLMSKLFQLCFGCLKFMISLPPNLPPRLSCADATWSWSTLSPTWLWPFAFTWPIAFLALIIVALVAKVFVAIPLKAFGACCCDKKPSAALSPERGSAASAVATV